MKIIFLDVDGVLNIMSDSYRTFSKPYGDHLEYHLVQRLNYLIKCTDVKIVVSSAWGVDELKEQLLKNKFEYADNIIDCTSNRYNTRGGQIQDWLNHNYVQDYLIIDDEISGIFIENNGIPFKNIIHVDMNLGISEYDIKEIIEYFKTGNRENINDKEKVFKQYYNRIVQLLNKVKDLESKG